MTIEVKNFAESPEYKALSEAERIEWLEKHLGETSTQLVEASDKLEEANKTSESSKQASEEIKQLKEQVTTLRANERRTRFTDVVKNPHRWYGDAEKHVARLERLADAFGEDSEDFKDYVSEQQTLAKNLAESEHFREIGTEQRSNADSGFRQALKSYQEANPGKTEAEAMAAVLAASPQYYTEYRKAMTEAAAKGGSQSVSV